MESKCDSIHVEITNDRTGSVGGNEVVIMTNRVAFTRYVSSHLLQNRFINCHGAPINSSAEEYGMEKSKKL